jgi:single-strand DNA-binding protein
MEILEPRTLARMTDNITLTGIVATPPRHITTAEGLPITSFRLASSQRRYNRSQQQWVDGETNWYTITVFRQLAVNAAGSLNKGDRIVVSGRVRIRDWKSDDKSGTTVDVEADSLGHDLLWGTTAFTRSVATGLANENGMTGPGEQFAAEASPPGEQAGGFYAEPGAHDAPAAGADADALSTDAATDDARSPGSLAVPF